MTLWAKEIGKQILFGLWVFVSVSLSFQKGNRDDIKGPSRNVKFECSERETYFFSHPSPLLLSFRQVTMGKLMVSQMETEKHWQILFQDEGEENKEADM